MAENNKEPVSIHAPSAPPESDVSPQPDKASSRRYFVVGLLGLAVAASFAVPVLRRTRFASAPLQPGSADLELAAMGAKIREVMPERAQQLEAFARRTVGLAPAAPIDWDTALRARPLLTEHNRVMAEYGRGDTVFFSGWLLAWSEAGTALLYSLANTASGSPTATHQAE